MKRFWQKPLSAALALVLTVGLVQGVVFPAKAADSERPAATGVCGDANGDSTLDLKDLVRTLAEVNSTALASTDALFTNWNYAVAEDANVIGDLLIQKDVFPARDAAMIEDFECGRPAGLTFYAGPTASVGINGTNHSIVGAIADEGWLGFENASYAFAETTSLKVTITQENPVLLPADSFYIITTGWKQPVSATKIGDDYILTFDESFDAISSFIVKISGAMGAVTIDKLMICDPIDNKLANGTKGVEYTVEIPAEAAGSTTLTVSYRVKGTADWTAIVPADDSYKFTPDTVGTYEVSITGETDGKVVYAAIMEFKTEDPDVIWDDMSNYTIGGAGVVVSELSGTPALAVNSGAGTWGYLENLNYDPGKAMDGIIVKMKSNNGTVTASSVYLYYNSNREAYASTVQSLDNDEYLFTFGTTINTVEKFSFEVKSGDTVFISYVKAYYDPQGSEETETSTDSNMVVDFESGLPSGSSFYSTACGPVISETDGNYYLSGQSSAGDWLGFQGASIALGKSVTKLKVTITQTGANPVSLTTSYFWLQTDTSSSLVPASVEQNGNEYTLTFNTAFSVLQTFTILINEPMGLVTIDNIMIVE